VGVAGGGLVSAAMKEGDSLGYGQTDRFSLGFTVGASVGVAVGG
jgi:hypothetical protein